MLTCTLQAPRLYRTLASPETCPVMATLSACMFSNLQRQHFLTAYISGPAL